MTDPDGNTSEFSACLVVPLKVNSTADLADAVPGDGICADSAGDCTLRAAIEEANANPGPDIIVFHIPGVGPHTIQHTAPLPSITETVTIDGTSEPDYTGTPVIELDGTNAGAGAVGLDVVAASSSITGLMVNNFDGAGIVLRTGGGNTVRASRIGTDGTATIDRGNGAEGIRVQSDGNLIGGPGAGDSNTISYSGSDGVKISSGTGNFVQANTIANNGSNGVRVVSGTGNHIKANRIFTNSALGIDLGGDGVTANDADDLDVGANNLQNFPVVASVTVGSTVIKGSITSTATSTDLRIEYFANTTCDSSGHGEGQRYLGFLDVTTSATGTADIGIVFAESFAIGEFITVTATNPDGNTSEFSKCTQVEQNLAVVNSADDGDDGTHCSLREAINLSNSTAQTEVIQFNIPGAGIQTIRPTSSLPLVFQSVIIDGFTQPGASPNTSTMGEPINAVYIIELDGSAAGGGAGLRIISAGVVVRGLVINRFGGDGIVVDAAGVAIEGNFIGTNATGTADLGNGGNGIFIDDARQNTIGGPLPGARNLISGNDARGIYLSGQGADLNTIQGNIIGLDATGGVKLGNATYGIEIVNGDNNVIGGTAGEARNVISGQGTGGIYLGSGANSNVVQGNYVGTDITGLVTDPDGVFPAGGDELGNRFRGIEVNGSSNNLIGGNRNNGEGNLVSGTWQGDAIYLAAAVSGNTVQGNLVGTDITGTKILPQSGGIVVFNNPGTVNLIGGTGPGEGNVVSGNGRAFDNRQGPGIEVFHNTIVQGNLVGTDITGMVALHNHGYWGIDTEGNNNTIGGTSSEGIYVRLNGNTIGGTSSEGIYVRLNGNTIGGTEPGAGNVIAYNLRGVYVTEQSGHAILGNSIFANTELGIDLTPAGIAPNDLGDADAGVNNLQNFPEIATAVRTFGGVTQISGSLNTTADTTTTIEFFSNAICHVSGHGEGEVFLGRASVATDGAGDAAFSHQIAQSVPAGHHITATATDDQGNTSEFSACVQVVFAPGVPSTSGVALAIMALLTGAAFLWALRRRRSSEDQAV